LPELLWNNSNAFLKPQLRILDNDSMFDPVILIDCKNNFLFHVAIKNDYCSIVFSNYVPDESVIHKK
jgi:hypothetical protein